MKIERNIKIMLDDGAVWERGPHAWLRISPKATPGEQLANATYEHESTPKGKLIDALVKEVE